MENHPNFTTFMNFEAAITAFRAHGKVLCECYPSPNYSAEFFENSFSEVFSRFLGEFLESSWRTLGERPANQDGIK